MKIKTSTLNLAYQTRFGINEELVDEYAALMREGVTFPPVSVIAIDDSFALVDGYHRLAAVTKNGGDEIEAVVTQGTHADALRAAVKANCDHGQRRTNSDKRRALEVTWENRDILFTEFLGQDKDGHPNGLPSSRQLAEITGVSVFTASHFIKESQVLDSNTPHPEDDLTRVTSSHLEERNADVRTLLKAHKDRFEMDIPERILPAFLSVGPKKMTRELRKLRNHAEVQIAGGDIAFIALGQQFLMNLDNAINNLKFWTPYCVCRACRGEGCYRCSNHGFQSLSQYNQNPPEMRATRR